MCQLKKLVAQARGMVDLATSFFAYLASYDGQDWEEVDDLLLSENRSDPLPDLVNRIRASNGSSDAFGRFGPAPVASSDALNVGGVPHHPWN